MMSDPAVPLKGRRIAGWVITNETRSEMLSIRLTPTELRMLKARAADFGLAPSALARMLITAQPS